MVLYRLHDGGHDIDLPAEFIDYPGGPLARVRDIMTRRYETEIYALSRRLARFVELCLLGWTQEDAADEAGFGHSHSHPAVKAALELSHPTMGQLIEIAAHHVIEQKERKEDVQVDRPPASGPLKHRSLGPVPGLEGTPSVLAGVLKHQKDRPLDPDWEPRPRERRFFDPEEVPVPIDDLEGEVEMDRWSLLDPLGLLGRPASKAEEDVSVGLPTADELREAAAVAQNGHKKEAPMPDEPDDSVVEDHEPDEEEQAEIDVPVAEIESGEQVALDEQEEPAKNFHERLQSSPAVRAEMDKVQERAAERVEMGVTRQTKEFARWKRQELPNYLELVAAGYNPDTSPHFRRLSPAQLEEVKRHA